MLHRPDFDAQLSAALGPTNTGKTWLAVTRMLARSSGCIGLPLRLLAREVYDRIVSEKGIEYAALVTGEEKIIPKTALWYACTVESMPTDRNGVPFAFVGIDEVQLADDPDRGHVFTDRILHMRGREETLLMGSARMQNILHRMQVQNTHEIRERFSPLTHTGHGRLNRLPKRSAIVAFSVDQVYALAEVLRQTRGGAAIVMGNLSPQTRNAQVALFQSGEVDYLVATDAIGLGLNMDIHHVAMAQTSKFDGHVRRELFAHELAQIAGRAGRGTREGSFGTTGEARAFDEKTVRQIETSQFQPISKLVWRNSNLDFTNVQTVNASLAKNPEEKWLIRVKRQIDERAWYELSKPQNIAISTDKPLLQRLWEIAQIPDFRKIGFDQHLNLLEQLAEHLLYKNGQLPDDWFASHIKRFTAIKGSVDHLASALAAIRTWSYCANRGNWLNDPVYWQEQCAEIEARLSDALHQQLMARFVDKRTSVLLRTLRKEQSMLPKLSTTGSVCLDGHIIGELKGISFVPADGFTYQMDKKITGLVKSILQDETEKQMQNLIKSKDEDFALDDKGQILWQNNPVAVLSAGNSALSPSFEILSQSDDASLQPVKERIENWLHAELQKHLSPLLELNKQVQAETLDPAIRGLAYRLVENLGAIDRRTIAREVKAINQEQRTELRTLGLRFGEFSLFFPALLRPAPAKILALLLAFGPSGNKEPFFAPPGLTSIKADNHPGNAVLCAVGLRKCGDRLIRLDMLERVGTEIRNARTESKDGQFQPTLEMVALLGCSKPELAGVLASLGYKKIKTVRDDDGEVDELACLWQSKGYKKIREKTHRQGIKPNSKNRNTKTGNKKAKTTKQKKIDPDSPFAVLQGLKLDKP